MIINAAAYVKVDEAERNPEEAFKVNAIGALNVARISSRVDAVNVYISTDYVFDGREEKENPTTRMISQTLSTFMA